VEQLRVFDGYALHKGMRAAIGDEG